MTISVLSQRTFCLAGSFAGAVLFSLSSLSPALAAMPVMERAQSGTEIAGFGGLLDAVRQGQDIYQDHQESTREQEIHDAQMAERERQLVAYEEAQAAAAEATRQEAARRQALWQSMTPQQRHSYMEEQREAQERQDEAANLFMLGLGSVLIEGMLTPNCRLYEGSYGNVYESCS